MAETDAKTKRGWEPPRYFHIIGLITAVVALVLTVYFSVRAERTKALTLKYLGERALVSFQSRASTQLGITLGGERLQAPWLLSARLENTGNQPVEARDIESPLQLTFEQGRVVGAEVVEKSQQGLVAKATHDGNTVTVSHTLLNPGDWIGFDIFFDGEPSRPKASVRISGVSDLTQVTNLPGEKKPHPMLWSVPIPLMYLVLFIGSVASLFTTGAGIGVAVSTIRTALRPAPSPAPQAVPRPIEPFDETRILSRLQPVTRLSNVVFWMLDDQPSQGWLENPKLLEGLIAKQVPAAVLAALNVTIPAVAERMSRELKEQFKQRVASDLFMRLPSGPDQKARDEILGLDLGTTSTAELIVRAM